MSMSPLPEKKRVYKKPVVDCSGDKIRVKKSFQADSDINAIVARYQKTGLLENVRENPGVFADVSQVKDFTGMVRQVRFAQEAFEQLPADLKTRFSHDPALLIEFVSNADNRAEAIKLGILPKPDKKAVPKEPPAPVPAKAEEPPAPSKAAKAD